MDNTFEIGTIAKGSNDFINKYLKVSEFDCHCTLSTCNRTLVNRRTVSSFQLLREYFGKPILVNSAYRCQQHNASIGGKVNSYHLLGAAMDIRPKDPLDYYSLLILAEKFFDVVIPYKEDGFIHVHQLS